MKTRQASWLAALAMTALTSWTSGSSAAVYSWTGGSSAAWDMADNWTSSTVPGVADTAAFQAAAYSFNPNIGWGATVAALRMDAASGPAVIDSDGGWLVLATGAIDVAAGSGGLTVNAPLQCNGLTKTGGGTLNVAGDMTSVSGTLKITGGTLLLGMGPAAGLREGWLAGNHVGDTALPAAWNQVTLNTRRAYDVQDADGPPANWGHDTTWIYSGKIYYPGVDGAAHDVTFEWHIDDNGALKIDGGLWTDNGAGNLIGGNGQWNFRGTNTLAPGWHDFELRLYNGGGPGGQSGGIGFGFDPLGGTTTVMRADPGDRSVYGCIGLPREKIVGPIVMSGDAILASGGNSITTSSLSGGAANQAQMSAGNLTITDGESTTFAGTISGTGNLTKTGWGAWTLKGANVYGGATAVNDGVLQLAGGDNRLPATTRLTLGTATVNTSGKLVLGDNAAASNQTLTGLVTSGTGAENRVVGGNAAANSVLTLAIASGSNTYDGLLGGPGANENKLALVKAGAGTLLLSGTSTYAGGTTINAGILQVGGNGSLGAASGPLVFSGGTLQTVGGGITAARAVTLNASGGTIHTNGFDSVFSAPIGGPGALTKTGGGTLTLSGVNSYAGGSIINGGAIVFQSPAAIGGSGPNVTINGPSVAAAAGFAINQAFAARIASTSTGAVALAVDSSNDLDFSAAGANLPNVSLGAVGTAAYGGTLTPVGTTYRLGGGGGILTYTGPLSGANNVQILGDTVYFKGANKDYSGLTTLSGGTLRFDNGSLSSNTASKINFSGGMLQWANGNSQDVSGRMSAVGAGQIAWLDIGANNVAFSTIVGGPGGLTKLGTGTLNLLKSNTYTGDTRIAAGTLLLGVSSAPSTSLALQASTLDMNAADGGTLAFAPGVTAATLGGLKGSRDLDLGTAKLTINGSQDTTYTGTLSGGASVSLVKSGANTLTLGGSNAYVGTTQIASGTLKILASTPGTSTNVIPDVSVVSISLGATLDATDAVETVGSLAGSGNVLLGSAATTLTVGGSQAATFAGVISGPGSLVKDGAASWTVRRGTPQTYTGSTLVKSGTLILDFTSMTSPVNVIAPSSPLLLAGGTLQLQGKATGTSSQDFNVTTIQPGSSAVRVEPGAGTKTTLALGVIQRNAPGGVLQFVPPAQPAKAAFTTNTSVNNKDDGKGILSGAMTWGTTQWAQVTGTAAPFAIAGLAVGDADFETPTNNVDVTGDVLPGLWVDTVNSIRFRNTTQSATVDLISNWTTLAITSGGILVSSDVGNHAAMLSGGTLQLTNSSPGRDLVVHQHNTANTLEIDSTIVDAPAPAGRTGTMADNSNVITGIDTTDLYPGMSVSGGNMPLTTKITAVDAVNGRVTLNNIYWGAPYTPALSFTSANGLTKAGAGTLVLSGGSNTFTGPLTVAAGTLELRDNAAGAASAISLAGGAVQFHSNLPYAFEKPVTGCGSLVKSGDSELVLNGFARVKGATAVNEGYLTLGRSQDLDGGPVQVAAGATLTVTGGAGLRGQYYSTGIQYASAGGYLGGTWWFPEFDTLAGLQNALAARTPNLVAISNDRGEFYFEGANFPDPYKGGDAGGTMWMQAIWTGKFKAAADGDYLFQTSSDDGSVVYIDGRKVADNNRDQGMGTWRGGTIALTAGLHDIVIAMGNGWGGYGVDVQVQRPGDPGPMRLSNSDLLTVSTLESISGEGTLDLGGGLVNAHNSADSTFAGELMGAGHLEKSGPGTLTLTRANSYTGGTTVSGGKLSVTADESLGDLFVGAPLTLRDGGALRVAGTDAFQSPREVMLGPGEGVIEVATTNSAGATFVGPIAGSGGLTKSGPGLLELDGMNVYTGGTTVTGGQLVIGTVDALPSGGSLTIRSGGMLVLAAGLSSGGASAASTASAVPEPGTLVLAAIALAALLAARWRKPS